MTYIPEDWIFSVGVCERAKKEVCLDGNRPNYVAVRHVFYDYEFKVEIEKSQYDTKLKILKMIDLI